MIRYIQSGADDFGGPSPRALDDGSDSWWAGAAQCCASVAIAGALAANTLAAQINRDLPRDDQPPGGLRGVADENSWQNPVAPEGWSYRVPRYWEFEQHEQASGLFGPPDYGGDMPIVQPPGPQYVPMPWAWEPEDTRVPPPTPIAVEDDSWWLGPAPAPPINVVPAQWGYEQHEQANGLRGVPETDPWPAVVVMRGPSIEIPNTVPAAWSFEQHEGIPFLVPLPIDDETQPLYRPPPAVVPLPVPWWNVVDELANAPATEDYWRNWVAPVVASLIVPRPWIFDQLEQAAGLTPIGPIEIIGRRRMPARFREKPALEPPRHMGRFDDDG